MFTLGSWIYQGRAGLERDLKEAFKWQKKAADVGHPGALFNIGEPCEVHRQEPQSQMQHICIMMMQHFIVNWLYTVDNNGPLDVQQPDCLLYIEL